MQRSLILASTSPYRRELLARLGMPFEAVPPDVDEAAHPGESPQALVERLAIAKAQAVARVRPHTLVIGSDQVAVHAGRIMGKPHTHANAVAQLEAVSGETVVLYTGLALVDADSGRVQHDIVPFRVAFRRLTALQIENYLRKEQPYNCAGSVKSEGLGIALLARMEGEDPNALIGLPLIRLVSMLEHEGVGVV
jgi:septum formation protein